MNQISFFVSLHATVYNCRQWIALVAGASEISLKDRFSLLSAIMTEIQAYFGHAVIRQQIYRVIKSLSPRFMRIILAPLRVVHVWIQANSVSAVCTLTFQGSYDSIYCLLVPSLIVQKIMMTGTQCCFYFQSLNYLSPTSTIFQLLVNSVWSNARTDTVFNFTLKP